MRWLKRDMWKVGIIVAGVLLLVFMILVPVSKVVAHESVSGSATLVTVMLQATPTVDATVTALSKEKLQHENDWLWNYGATILTSLFSTLALAAAGIFTVVRYFSDRRDAREKQEEEAERLVGDRQAEREKRAEERFQSVVESLGSANTATQVGAAIMLRTFLQPGYEQFYSQAFDLAVAYLRLRDIGSAPESPDSLNQALIRVFRESFPLARDLPEQSSQSPDALGIRLDRAYLVRSDLRNARMPESYLREANLAGTNLSGANLRDAKLTDANLDGTNLRGANLWRTDFSGANCIRADFSGANLRATKLYGVKNLTKEQLEACKAKGAIIDEDITTSLPVLPTMPPPPSQQSS